MKEFLSKSFVKDVIQLLGESRTEELGRLKAKELQKIRLIPLDMQSAREAIYNIMYSESVEKGSITYDFSLSDFFQLNLDEENISSRNKYRFHDYYQRFKNSRHRGFDFEGLVAGFINGNISTGLNTPYDVIKDDLKFSLKTVKSESESVVLKSVGEAIKNYINEKINTGIIEDDKATQIKKSSDPFRLMVKLGYGELIDEMMDVILSDLNGMIVGVPKTNSVKLYFFSSEKIKDLIVNSDKYAENGKDIIAAPKTSGSQQLRFKSAIFRMADNIGEIIFPNLTDEDYEEFLTPNTKSQNVINLLDKFGERYGVKKMGQTLPQDMVKDLGNNENFILDLVKILSHEDEA
jgi:hypothetical protein